LKQPSAIEVISLPTSASFAIARNHDCDARWLESGPEWLDFEPLHRLWPEW
jgi:hypothetical protein